MNGQCKISGVKVDTPTPHSPPLVIGWCMAIPHLLKVCGEHCMYAVISSKAESGLSAADCKFHPSPSHSIYHLKLTSR